MPKKELTEFDIIKKQFSKLDKLNQRLKNIASIYYIAYDGTVYMKSLVGFIEKFIHLSNPSDIDRFMGCMILPNEFFEFSKKAKKSKLTITATEKAYYLGQDDNDELKYTINIVNPNNVIDKEYIDANIKPKMYKRFFNIYTVDSGYSIYKDDKVFNNFTDKETEDIAGAKALFIKFNNSELTITKNLMLDIKKNDKVSIARIGYMPIENNLNRVLYMLKQECDIYELYTIFNTLQS